MQISGTHNHTLLVEGILRIQSSRGKTAQWYKAEGFSIADFGYRIWDCLDWGYRIWEFIDGRTCLKYVVYVQGQGADSVLKRNVHVVREHLKLNRNAAIGRKMHI